jgi:hypothetical protein
MYGDQWLSLSYDDYISLQSKHYGDMRYALHECEQCSLSRTTYPEKRALIEKTIISIADACTHDKSTPLVITDLGSGFLYQTYMIVLQLARQGYHNISLNLIDPLYTNLCKTYRTTDNKPAQQVTDSKTHIMDNQYHILTSFFNDPYKNLTQDMIDIHDMHAVHTSLYVFLDMLHNIPDIRCKVFLYSHADDYIHDTFMGTQRLSNIVYAIDYLVDLYPDMYHAWNKLCTQACTPKGRGLSVSKHMETDKEHIFYSYAFTHNISHYDSLYKLII